MSSAGIGSVRSLLAARSRLNGNGGDVVLKLGGNDSVRRLLDAVGMIDEFVIEHH